jgi:hypothetical protein
MSRFTFEIYYINDTAWGEDEHLHQDTADSAYEAIETCLDPNKRADYIRVLFAIDGKEFTQISPYAIWGTWENFITLARTHVRATAIQLNIELSLYKAAEALLIQAHDNKRLATKPK